MENETIEKKVVTELSESLTREVKNIDILGCAGHIQLVYIAMGQLCKRSFHSIDMAIGAMEAVTTLNGRMVAMYNDTYTDTIKEIIFNDGQ